MSDFDSMFLRGMARSRRVCARGSMPAPPVLRLGVTALVWASTAGELFLLIAWKLWGIPGTGNLLTAWIVIGGLIGVSLLLGPPSATFPPDESVFGYRVARVLDVAMVAALFWFGHDLLGVMWLLAGLGNYVHSRRSARYQRGGAHG